MFMQIKSEKKTDVFVKMQSSRNFEFKIVSFFFVSMNVSGNGKRRERNK